MCVCVRLKVARTERVPKESAVQNSGGVASRRES